MPLNTTQLAVALLALSNAPGFSTAPAAQWAFARSTQAEDRAHAEQLRALADLEARLEKIQGSRSYEPLFESVDPTIVGVQSQLAWAQKAVHDAKTQLEREGVLDTNLADAFHNHLREYRLNVTEMPPGHTFGGTVVPDGSTMKKLAAELTSAGEAANKIAGFEEVSVRGLRPDATLREAVDFGLRSMKEVYWLLDHRTLTYVTSQGINAGRSLRASLDAVWQALNSLVGEDGELAVPLGEDGKAPANPLATLKTALTEASKQASFYRRGYLPNAWRDAHRRRAEQIEARLSPDGFQKSLLAVKALKAPPKR